MKTKQNSVKALRRASGLSRPRRSSFAWSIVSGASSWGRLESLPVSGSADMDGVEVKTPGKDVWPDVSGAAEVAMKSKRSRTPSQGEVVTLDIDDELVQFRGYRTRCLALSYNMLLLPKRIANTDSQGRHPQLFGMSQFRFIVGQRESNAPTARKKASSSILHTLQPWFTCSSSTSNNSTPTNGIGPGLSPVYCALAAPSSQAPECHPHSSVRETECTVGRHDAVAADAS